MSDRTYVSFSIPLSVIADPPRAAALRSALGITTTAFDAAVLGEPQNDEPAGVDALAIRCIDGRPCLVWEKEDAKYGGTSIADDLITAGIPFIQRNAVGREYAPTSTVFTGSETEIIRLDHDLAPIVGIEVVQGRVVVDPGEVADFERYARLRAAVLMYPATPVIAATRA
jgi:hypothetical protein